MQGGPQMRGNLVGKKISKAKFIWLLVFLLFLELAVISGRIGMTTFLPLDAERQTASAVITGSRPDTLDAVLSSAAKGAGEILHTARQEQRIRTRTVSRANVFLCGLFLLCLYHVIRKMLYALSDNRPYRKSNYILSYIYRLAYL